MTRNEFIKALIRNLSPLSSKDKDKTISYYQELIDDKLESGKNESDIISELGSPILIANKIKQELSQKEQVITEETIEKKSNVGIILAIILGFPIWFSLLITIFAVIFSIFVSIYAVLISLIASTFAIGIYGIVQVLCCFYYFSISAIYALSILGMGLVAIGLSILLYYLSIFVIKYTFKFTKWFFKKIKKVCLSMIGGKNVKKN